MDGREATRKMGKHSRDKRAQLVLLLTEHLQTIQLRGVCGENRSCSRECLCGEHAVSECAFWWGHFEAASQHQFS